MASQVPLLDEGWSVSFSTSPSQHEHVDVFVLQLDSKDEPLSREIIEHHPAVVIYQRSDCAPISDKRSIRELLKQKNIKYWIKEVGFRDAWRYNQQSERSRVHFRWIRNGYIEDSPDQGPMYSSDEGFSEADLAKIRPFFPIHLWSRFDIFASQTDVVPVRERPVDVFFAGEVIRSHNEITQHRQLLCETLTKCGVNAVVVTGRCLKTQQYLDLLKRSKILVSPYGYGIYSWKEIEAIYSGCIVVKPRSEMITTYGFDPYSHDRIVYCDPALRDLSKKITRILENQEHFSTLAEKNRADILSARKISGLLSADIIKLLESCL